MPRKLTQEEVIKRFKQIHGNKFDYSLVEYKGSHIEVNIICPEHGIFEQKPYVHLNGHGCSECRKITISKKLGSNINEFIKKANKVHDNFYSYPNAVYVNNKTNIEIECPIHGPFTQRPEVHMNGHRCKKCAFIDVAEKNRKTSHFDNINYYSKINQLKGQQKGHLYQILIFNNKECFSKIGITSINIKKRYHNSKLPKEYDYIILDDIIMTNLETAIREKELNKQNKLLKFNPLIKFGGYTECYKERIKL